MFKLRPYQENIVGLIYEAWQRARVILVVLPTGSGKTATFSTIIRDHKGASAAVVHRREIVKQISLSLAKLGVKHRVIAPPKTIKNIRRTHLKQLGKSFVDPHALCGVASVQTMTSKSSEKNLDLQRWLNQVTLCVFDEAHHYVKAGLWARAVDAVSKARILMVTATPERADGQGLGAHASGYVEEMIEGPSTQWMIENSYLSKFRYIAPRSDFTVEGLAVTASGDFNARALRERVVASDIVGNIVEKYLEYTPGRQAIIFASDVDTANDVAEAFRLSGVTAAALSGKTDEAVREHELALFEAEETQVLVNVDLFDEGFDIPAVSVCGMIRPTESLAKYLQMIGRVLRILEGKEDAVILDLVRNYERHGMPNWPRNWTLDDREKGSSKKSDMVPQKVCKTCTQPYEAFYKVCPFCGSEQPPPAARKSPEQVDGDLFELDVEGMAAMFKKQADADMSDSDYRTSQIVRNIPPQGRAKDLKRHERAKYRRQILRDLVGWWVGMAPPGRDMSETHRRFYIRFGIDIGSAFTLNADDTDALCILIQKHFHKDLER